MRKDYPFFLIVLITTTITRIWSASLLYFIRSNSQLIQKIISDPWHHYQIGLLLLLLTYPLRRFFRPKVTAAIGLGIFLEEWPVFLNDLGLNTIKYYHTKLDFIIIIGLVGLAYILSHLLHNYHTTEYGSK